MPGTKTKDVHTYGNRAAGKSPGTANTKECSKTQIGGKRIVGTVERVAGDADANGQITLRDAVVIARYLAGGWNVSVDLSSADVNGDGSVSLLDVVLIKRFLVGGWGVTLQ